MTRGKGLATSYVNRKDAERRRGSKLMGEKGPHNYKKKEEGGR